MNQETSEKYQKGDNLVDNVRKILIQHVELHEK